MTELGGAGQRLLNLLPRGASKVSAGLVVLGVSSYAFLALARRGLDDAPYSVLSVLWVLLFTVGPGIFLPLEQELGRVVASRRAIGQAYRPVVVKAVWGVVGVVLAFTIAFGVFGDLVGRRLLGGDAAAGWSLVAGVAALAISSLARGLFAGRGQFGRYAVQLGADGSFRVLMAVGLIVAQVHSVWIWGTALAAAPLLSVLVSAWGSAEDQPEPAGDPVADGIEFSHALGWLLGATLASQALANGAVIVAQLAMGPGQEAVAGSLLIGLVVARVPLFLYAAVQASLLPRLAEVRAHRDLPGFVRLLASTTAVVTALGVANIVAVAVFGRWVMRALFGQQPLSEHIMVLLAVATAAFMIASVLTAGLVALEHHMDSCIAWLFGLAVFALVFFQSSSGLDERVTWSYLGGAVGAAIAMLSMLVLRRSDLESGVMTKDPVPS
jgi:O-antigen/teichoic acid export membrane protein